MLNVLKKEPETHNLTDDEIVHTFWDNLINKRNNAAWQSVASPEITFVGSLSSRVWNGFDGIIEYSPLMFDRFEGFGLKVREVLHDGNTSVALLTFSGRNTGGLFGNEPCGKQVTYDAVAIMRLREGKIYEVRVTGNVIQILEQVGKVI